MSGFNKANLDEIYAEILSSGILGHDLQNRKWQLFNYLWEHVTGVRDGQVSQYTIAFDVLGRDENFNPETDGIVRADIGRLRQALKLFSSQSLNYVVEIPKRKYELIISKKVQQPKPYFQPKKMAVLSHLTAGLIGLFGFYLLNMNPFQQTALKSKCSKTMPIIAVTQQSELNNSDALIFRNIENTVMQNTHLAYRYSICEAPDVPQYIVEFSTSKVTDNYHILLEIRRDGEERNLTVVTADATVVNNSWINNVNSEITQSLNNVLKPYGILVRNAIMQDWGNRDAKSAYECFLEMYAYYQTETDEDYETVHTCLELSVKGTDVALDIKGGLAASYLEQVRSYRAFTVNNPRERAFEILSENEGNIYQSAELMIAKMAYEADAPNFSPDRLDNDLLAAETAFNLNPHVLGTASAYAGFKLGDWERASRLSDRVKQIFKQQDQSLHIIDAATLVMSKKSNVDMELCYKYYSEYSIMANIIVKACASKEGNLDWLTRTNEALKNLGYGTVESQISFVENRFWNSSIATPLKKLLIN